MLAADHKGAWLRSRSDLVLRAAFALIVLWLLIPGLHVGALIVALLALAGVGFKAIGTLGRPTATHGSRS